MPGFTILPAKSAPRLPASGEHPPFPKEVAITFRRRIILWLLALSFVIRIAFWLPVAHFQVAPLFDEEGYFTRALGIREAVRDLAAGRQPSPESLGRAYGRGYWPPFHPLLLAVGMATLGPRVSAARLVVVVVSSLTTPLVYLLTRSMVSGRAARRAALAHIFYPGFIAYSHYLWSETAYIFLLLLAVYFTFRAGRSGGSRAGGYVIMAGVAGGLTALTRVAVLPLVPVMWAWLWLVRKGRPGRCLLPLAFFLVFLVVLLPWLTALAAREGRPVSLSTKTGWYLYLGNNPWVPDGTGAVGSAAEKAMMRTAMAEYGDEHDLSPDEAARRLALKEIRSRPGRTLNRAVQRMRMLWAPDSFSMRHLLAAVYPPIIPAAVVPIWCVVILTYLLFLALAVRGFLAGGWKDRGGLLLLCLLAAGTAPHLLTLGFSRLHQPLLALLLPAVGRGLAAPRRALTAFRRCGLAAAVLAVWAVAVSALPVVVTEHLRPSSYYGGIIALADRILGTRTVFTDLLSFRVLDRQLGSPVHLSLEGGRFCAGGEVSGDYSWTPSAGNRETTLGVFSAGGDLRLTVGTAAGDAVTVRPLAPAAWRRWMPTGIDGIEYRWEGLGRGWRTFIDITQGVDRTRILDEIGPRAEGGSAPGRVRP